MLLRARPEIEAPPSRLAAASPNAAHRRQHARGRKRKPPPESGVQRTQTCGEATTSAAVTGCGKGKRLER